MKTVKMNQMLDEVESGVLIKQMLKKDVEELSAEQEADLGDFVKTEIQAKEASKQLNQGILKFTNEGEQLLEESLDEAGFLSGYKKQTLDIFKQTILKRMEEVSANLVSDLKKGEGILFNIMLSERVIDILDSIYDFKKKIDQHLPGVSDKILTCAAPMLITLASIYMPTLSVVLKTTGIVDKVVDFLQEENLKGTIDKLREGLEKNNKEQGLKGINKIAELVAETGINPNAIVKLGLTSPILDLMVKEVQEAPKVKRFIIEVSAYVNKMFPKDDKDIDKMLDSIKKTVVSNLKENGVPAELIQTVEKQLDTKLAQVKEVLKPIIDPHISVFDKIQAQQKGAKLMLEETKVTTDLIKESLPQNTALANKVGESFSKIIKEGVKIHLQAGIDKIVDQLKEPKVKNIAQKALGAGHTNLLEIERGIQMTQVKKAPLLQR